MSGKTARKLRKDEKEMISNLIHSQTFEQSSFKGRIGLIKDTLAASRKKNILKYPLNSDTKNI